MNSVQATSLKFLNHPTFLWLWEMMPTRLRLMGWSQTRFTTQLLADHPILPIAFIKFLMARKLSV
uniref:Uncharacterized protein n=1 Tax=Rhizophora mucronata TaxID=61149 RepID=A0A2P2J603_RHIMU